jgi:hypothetical protein
MTTPAAVTAVVDGDGVRVSRVIVSVTGCAVSASITWIEFAVSDNTIGDDVISTDMNAGNANVALTGETIIAGIYAI